MGKAFKQLSKCLDASSIEEWTAEEQNAMDKHGEYLKIYEVISEKCKIFHA